MFTPNTNTTTQKASQLSLNKLSRLVSDAGVALTDWLRKRHEGALRQLPRAARMRSANATPA